MVVTAIMHTCGKKGFSNDGKNNFGTWGLKKSRVGIISATDGPEKTEVKEISYKSFVVV